MAHDDVRDVRGGAPGRRPGHRLDEHWGTKVGLVLAMAGNAVGLGNFLRFPAQAASHGGGAFLVPYLISFLLMGLPLLYVEWTLGRYGGRFGRHSIPGIFAALGGGRLLRAVGALGLFIPLGVAAFYAYIESWALAYAVHSLLGTFERVPAEEFFAAYVGLGGGGLTAVPLQAAGFFLVTLALNVFILSRGVAKGIERTAKVAMPLLLVCGAVLAIKGLTLGVGEDPGVIVSPLEGLNFVWEPNLSGLGDPSTWLAAAGQVFFTLSVGMGAVACYASYVRPNDDIALASTSAGWLNEFVEVVLGASIMIPIATAYLGLAEVQQLTEGGGGGFQLGFLTLPTLFTEWGPGWGAVAGLLWFGLLFFAGITSSLAMGQPVMAFFEDEMDISRTGSALLFGASVLVLGGLCVWLFPGGAFDEFDYWAGTFALVVFGLVEVLVFVHVLGLSRGWDELQRGARLRIPRLFLPVVRWVTPTFIGFILVASLIQPAGGDWAAAVGDLLAGRGWSLAPTSVVGKVLHVDSETYAWFVDGAPTADLVQDLARLIMTLTLVLFAWLILRLPTGGGAPGEPDEANEEANP